MSRQSVKLLENLPGNRLPTNLQLMQRYECIRKSNYNTNTTDICEILVEEVLAIWNKAYIPVIEKRNIKKKLVDIQKKYINIKKNKKDLTRFDVLFDIKPKFGHFRNEEDRLFYLDQQGERVATIGPLDKADNKKLAANKQRYKRDHTPKKNRRSRRWKKKVEIRCMYTSNACEACKIH